MVDVHSKAIRSVSHRKANNDLYIRMHDGTSLVYYDVPREVYHAFINAPSVGQYYNSFIRDNYAFD